MPNGVSCLFFAGKNLIYGKKEDNLFKEGIGVIQTVRGADFLASADIGGKAASASAAANSAKNPLRLFIGDAAKVLKKILYPFFILSGIYNTVKSDDKVKTGTGQAAGIGLMYTLEQIAEKNLVKAEKQIFSNPASLGNTKRKAAWYILRGAVYAAASMLGYTAGTKTAEFSIDKIRNIKETKQQKDEITSRLDNVFDEDFYAFEYTPDD